MRGGKSVPEKCRNCPYRYSEEEWLPTEDGRGEYCAGTYYYCKLAEQGEKCPFSYVKPEAKTANKA